MRELDRPPRPHISSSSSGPTGGQRVAIVGPGRLGSALARGLRTAGAIVEGPLGRGERIRRSDLTVLCVPDSEIGSAAAAVAGSAPFVGHTSGATTLAALEPVAARGGETFGLHPLATFPGGAGDAERFAGSACAITGSSVSALAAAGSLARVVGMEPFEIRDEDRAAYHAAASIASNLLVTVEAAAEAVAAGAGLTPSAIRSALGPLVRTTVENWLELGPAAALTGPVARGDEATVAAQREAVGQVAPSLLALFDALVERTRALAATGDVTALCPTAIAPSAIFAELTG